MYPMDPNMTTKKVKKLHETETESKDSETKNEESDVPDGPKHDNKKGEKNYMKLKLKARTVKLKTNKVMYLMDPKMTTKNSPIRG